MTKDELYESLLPQLKAVVEGESDMIANMANVCAILHEEFHFWWTGFYRVLNDEASGTEQLVLGPFQGPMACTRIACGRGVCGSSWAEDRTLVVPNVHEFPGHIACSSASNSEIVVPIHDAEGRVTGVLDIDSEKFETFDAIDAKWLEQVVVLFV